MKNMRGYVIVDSVGYPVLFDYRMPCYWNKKEAVKEAKEYGFWRVKKVTLKISFD